MRAVRICHNFRDLVRYPKEKEVATAFESEFLSQGELLNERAKAGRLAAERAARSVDEGVTHLVIAARGSSDSAALYLQYLLGQELGLLAALATPLLYADPLGINLTGALVMGISQSGQSPGVVSVLAAARAQGRPAHSDHQRRPLAPRPAS